MSNSTQLSAGFFCWVDVAVSDPASTHKFFTELFGWGRRDRPAEENQAYSIMTLNGHHVAGICEVEGSGPSQWMSYLLVDDLDTSTERAEELGGRILKAYVTIPTFGKMTVVEDPTGAVFALWESLRGETAEPLGPGSVYWNELVTDDPEKAARFYNALAGWTSRRVKLGNLDYHIFSKNDEDVCGMMALPPREYERSIWMVHFQVLDCDLIRTRARALGGSVAREPFEVTGVGRCALLKDPCGGVFGVVRPQDDDVSYK